MLGGSALVEEDFHPRSGLFGHAEALAGELQHRFDLLFRHTGEPLKKLADRGALFEIVEQCFHRNAVPRKIHAPLTLPEARSTARH